MIDQIFIYRKLLESVLESPDATPDQRTKAVEFFKGSIDVLTFVNKPPDPPCPHVSQEPLVSAMEARCIKTVKALLEAGVVAAWRPEYLELIVDEMHRTESTQEIFCAVVEATGPQHWDAFKAVRMCNVACVTALIAASVVTVDALRNGDTLLHVATQIRDPGVIAALVSLGADRDKLDAGGLTPLGILICTGTRYGYYDTPCVGALLD